MQVENGMIYLDLKEYNSEIIPRNRGKIKTFSDKNGGKLSPVNLPWKKC